MAGSYDTFIEEAFVDPIRSVLIVDDDYPTYDEILASNESELRGSDDPERQGSDERVAVGDGGSSSVPTASAPPEKNWRSDPNPALNVIRQFRHPERPMLVDVDDGTKAASGDGLAAHLHQSDLLVLDFELEKSKRDDGTRAIEIVRKLMNNGHFNLVVIYTHCGLDRVFEDVLTGMMPPLPPLPSDEPERAEALLGRAEGVNSIGEDSFETSIDRQQYFAFRRDPEADMRKLLDDPIFGAFATLVTQAGWDPDAAKLVLSYLLRRVEERYPMDQDLCGMSPLRYSTRKDNRWIKSDSVFVSFAEKSSNACDLLQALRAALVDWHPAPSRLFLTKLRAEMDDSGIPLQDHALRRSKASALWYNQLLTAEESTRRALIADAVRRQSESLMDLVLPEVERFGERLLDSEVAGSLSTAGELPRKESNKICTDHFGRHWQPQEPDFIHAALLEHNEFVCCKRPTGWHLTTGHVFRVGSSYWICLSPACDLVPVRPKDAKESDKDRFLRFLAVELQKEANQGVNPRGISSNQHVFVSIDGKIEVFRYHGKSNSNSAPQWEVFFAEDRGRFDVDRLNNGELALGLRQLKNGSDGPTWQRCDAIIAGQLRYEYALNLLLKLGGWLSRVGLGFLDRGEVQ